MGPVTTAYVAGVNYTAWGAVEDMTMASNHWEQNCYNNRLQVTGMLLRTQAPAAGCPATNNQVQLTLGYYATGANNGNIVSQTISDGASWNVTQSYDYDALNRYIGRRKLGTRVGRRRTAMISGGTGGWIRGSRMGL